LRGRLAANRHVVVVGAGFVGMEVAAASRKAGAEVTVVETLDRVMARAVSPEVADHVTAVHAAGGTTVLFGRALVALHAGLNGRCEVELDDGRRIRSDVVVVGIGVLPNTELAKEAGLEVEDGVVVDEQLLTSDPRVSAIGDCASYPNLHAGRRMRLESVQNAVDQARHVADRLTGAPTEAYGKVPWFWTHQFDMRIQTAGIGGPNDVRVLQGHPSDGKFSVLRFQGDRLVAVESVNRTGDHIAARTLLAEGRLPSVDVVRRPGFALKAYATASIS
jgi:3-phenylpropionate/trans-cinnamate dioxygenase ferredoxin reductase subunit